jgi:hypothetical protein
MKKVIIGSQTLWYNKKLSMLFYDYRMQMQFPRSILNASDYLSFLTQIK